MIRGRTTDLPRMSAWNWARKGGYVDDKRLVLPPGGIHDRGRSLAPLNHVAPRALENLAGLLGPVDGRLGPIRLFDLRRLRPHRRDESPMALPRRALLDPTADQFHLLLQTDPIPLSKVMHRLMTGYAVTFNKRHRRSGYLFESRYNSISYENDGCLLDLIRYIHLTPFQAKVVRDIDDLDKYPWSGLSGIPHYRTLFSILIF